MSLRLNRIVNLGRDTGRTRRILLTLTDRIASLQGPSARQGALPADSAVNRPATAQVRLAHTVPAGSASTSTKTEAPAVVLGGTFVILATVNGAAQAALRVDSGATDVMFPRTVAARLISAGSLTHADYVTTKTYRLADGSLRIQKVYRLRSLKVGALIVRDMPCTISTDDTGLLGQSFLSKAQDGAMDNCWHVLTLIY